MELRNKKHAFKTEQSQNMKNT